MHTKLTLSLDQNVIKKAKEFAKDHHTSLSKMVENYFSGVVDSRKINTGSEKIKKLKGSWRSEFISDDKKALSSALKRKYL